MKIATWNINSIRLRKDLVKNLLKEYSVDVLLLQETKCTDNDFPAEFFAELGFPYLYYKGEKSYNGVAIISNKEFSENFSLEFYNSDKRHLAVKIGDIEIHNFYVPAGGDEPNPSINKKFEHKLEYIKQIHSWFINNRARDQNILLAGDINIAPNEHDVWSSKQLRNVVSHTQIERELIKDFIKDFEWTDLARKFIPIEEKAYSWWSYRNKDWKKSNRGRRLDHIWTTKNLSKRVKNYNTLSIARDWLKPSDHVPVIVELEQ